MQHFLDRTVRRIPFSIGDLAVTAACTTAFSAWNAYASGPFTPILIPIFAWLVATWLVTGGLVLRRLGLAWRSGEELPEKLLVGFFAFNTLLCASALLLPVSLILTTAVLSAVAWGVGLLVAAFEPASPPTPSDERRPASVTGLLCVLLVLLGATAWSRDALYFAIPRGDVTVYRPFGDSYAHAFFLGRVASPGVPINHFQTVGVPMGIYHFASYATPALICQASGITPMASFNTLQVPLGMFLAGLAAFVLARNWWGAWPAIGAAAFVFLPDAAWFGIQNYWFSFHWMGLIAPAGNFGIALTVLAWVLMFRGCRSGRKLLIAASFLTLGISVAYKSQLFAANALLLWIYPAFFFSGASRKLRWGWGCFAVATFVTAIALSQNHPHVPNMRLNGSGMKTYLPVVHSYTEWTPARTWLNRFTPTTSMSHNLRWGTVLLLAVTFGALGPLWLLLAALRRKQIGATALLFPCLLTANYLVMALGLARDNAGRIGEADELLHRPFIWVYFVVAAWIGGVLYAALFADGPPRRLTTYGVLVGLFVAALAIPHYSSRLLHQGPCIGDTANYSYMHLPTGLVDCCDYLWQHSEPAEVVQDSRIDPFMIVTGLSGRRLFASGITFPYATPTFRERVALLRDWETRRDEAAIRQFAAQHGIDWLLVRPGDMAQWPPELLQRPDFESRGYRLYHFAPAK